MSAIKDFFKKKKTEAKFKRAGGGHKLGDPSSEGSGSSRQQQAAAAAARQERQHPSTSAQQAGAAALNRMAAATNKPDIGSEEYLKKRQKALIQEQARLELEREKATDAEINKLKSVYGEKEEVVQETSGHLAAQGVYFRCPLIGDSVYPKDEMKAKIREFLYSQLEHERGLTATLIIHTCNNPKERVETCVETLCKYLDNIVLNPSEPKYRKIRKSNKAFQERVASLEGTEEFIRDCGFQLEMLAGNDGNEEEFWILPEYADLEHLTMLQDSLRSCEPLTAELDRGTIVIKPGSENAGRGIGSLPSDFFSVSAAEVRTELQSKADSLERESMLRTQAMRDKEAMAGRRKYRYCVVRIRFPDEYLLQGTFSVYEQLSAVLDFVADNLEVPLPFHLVDTVTGGKMLDTNPTLQELGLVPASILNFRWDPEIQADIQSSGAILACLKSSLL